jgi:hypothetical protein
VGALVSFERGTYSECAHAAHPGGETRYTTVDFGGVAAKIAKGRVMQIEFGSSTAEIDKARESR